MSLSHWVSDAYVRQEIVNYWFSQWLGTDQAIIGTNAELLPTSASNVTDI